MLMLLVGGVAYAVYALRVDEIRVTGVRTLDPRQVIEASGLKGGERILWIRLSSIARRIEMLPSVESVTAERSFPQTIVLNVSERLPLVRLGGRGGLAVDAQGYVFPSSVASIPILEGWRGRGRPGTLVDRASIVVLRAYAEFPERLRTEAARLVVGPPMQLVLRDGTEIRFGFHVDLVEKARAAEAVLAEESGTKLAYVDVRAPNVPVSRKREPPTPVPTSAPAPTPGPAASPEPAAARETPPAASPF